MTEQDQNAIIAKWMGIAEEKRLRSAGGGFEWVENPRPDYTRDLNAMASVEVKLFKDEQLRAAYEDELCDAANGVFSSAAQRAKAALRVLGLWTDEGAPWPES